MHRPVTPRAAPARLALLTVLLLAVLVVPGCGPDSASSGASGSGSTAQHPDEVRGEYSEAVKPVPAGTTPESGGGAVLALLGEIDSLNPYASSSVDASEVHSLIYPQLWAEQPDYHQGPPSFEPNIAEGQPEQGEDGLTLKIKLKDVKWSDGKPITAEDIRFSWQAALDPDVAWVGASHVDSITDVEVVGPREFVVHYRNDHPYQQMEINDISLLPRHTFGRVPFEKWQGYGDWESQAKVSGGPFLLDSYKPHEVILVRNPNYWKSGRPYLDKVIFRKIPDLRSQLTSVLSGGIDCMTGVVAKDVQKILDAKDLNLFTYLTRGYGYIGWNCSRWPFDDARVRNAMSHAIDVEDIVESQFRGHAKVAGPQIISSLWASNPNIEPIEFDPDRAEALLEEAGFARNDDGIYEKDSKPLAFTLLYNTGNTVRERICVKIKQNLSDIGCSVEVRPIEFNQMSTQLKKHEFDAYVGGWSVATKVDLKSTWHSTSVDGRFNYVHYQDPRVDEIIDTARGMSDFEKARPLWYELQDILHKDQPTTMLYEPRAMVALHKRFQNVRTNALRVYANIDEWWVPKAQRRFE